MEHPAEICIPLNLSIEYCLLSILKKYKYFQTTHWQPFLSKSRYIQNGFYMSKSWNKILIIITVVILTACLAVYVIWNKPHKNVEDANATQITAPLLYNSFVTDSANARSLYVDKIVEVKGEVAKIAVNQQAQQIILIKTAVEGAFINCTMEKEAAGLKAGDNTRIKGICSGYISGDADMGLPGDVFLIRGYALINR